MWASLVRKIGTMALLKELPILIEISHCWDKAGVSPAPGDDLRSESAIRLCDENVRSDIFLIKVVILTIRLQSRWLWR